MAIEQDDAAVPPLRGKGLWLTSAAMILYSVLKFGVGYGAAGPLLTVVAHALSYLLAICLYYAIARLACCRQYVVIWGSGLLAVVCGLLLSGPAEIRGLLCDWSMILVTGVIVGRLIGAQMSNQRAYIVGLLVVAFCGVLWLAPQWSLLANISAVTAGDFMQGTQSDLVYDLFGFTTARYGNLIERIWFILLRLLPGMMILSFVAQYSIGFIWFSSFHARERRESAFGHRLVFFRIPKMIAGIVLIGLVTRFALGGTVQVVADNVIAVLSIFYCVAGTAILEYHMRRGSVHWRLKAIAYVSLAMFGLIGFAVLTVLGLANSLRDWRTPLAMD